jgi:P27 family predicted phage terminase small subunit
VRPGPPPRPTQLRLIEGNPSKRPINANEPKAPVKVPPCPRQLSPGAKKVFRKLGKHFATLGIVAEIDEAALAILAESYASWLALIEQSRELGTIIKVNGAPVANPLLTRADREAEKVRKMLAEFGGTPAGRARLSVMGSSVPGEADDLSEFLSQPREPRMRIAR